MASNENRIMRSHQSRGRSNSSRTLLIVASQCMLIAPLNATIAQESCPVFASRRLVFEIPDPAIAGNTVIKDENGYLMYYNRQWQIGQQAGIFAASSTDGVEWTDLGPVLTPDSSSWEFLHLYNCSVLKEGSTYKMWYSAYWQVGYATSPDGLNWTKHPTPVLPPSGGSWDSFITRVGSVVFDSNQSLYVMWYTGGNGWFNRLKVGYATSPDGITWTKHPSPVLEYGDVIEWPYNHANVIGTPNGYEMYFSSSTGDIRLASSADGIGWTVDDCDPILAPANVGWDSDVVQAASALRDPNGTLTIWYAGRDSSSIKVGRMQSGIARVVFGDMNDDGVLDALDIQPFVDALLNQ